MSGSRGCRLAPLMLGAVVLVLLSVVTAWWSRYQEGMEKLERSRSRIAHYQALIQRRPRLEKGLAELRRVLAEKNYFLHEANPELAAADMQQRLKKLVTEAGGTLLSTQSLAANEQKDDGRWITVQVRMSGDTPTLVRLLQRLRDQRPVIRLERLTVRRRSHYRPRKGASMSSMKDELEIRFHAVGRWEEESR